MPWTSNGAAQVPSPYRTEKRHVITSGRVCGTDTAGDLRPGRRGPKSLLTVVCGSEHESGVQIADRSGRPADSPAREVSVPATGDAMHTVSNIYTSDADDDMLCVVFC